jgi:hypothetical protein
MGRKTGKQLHVLYLAELRIHAWQGKLLALYSWFHLFFLYLTTFAAIHFELVY